MVVLFGAAQSHDPEMDEIDRAAARFDAETGARNTAIEQYFKPSADQPITVYVAPDTLQLPLSRTRHASGSVLIVWSIAYAAMCDAMQ